MAKQARHTRRDVFLVLIGQRLGRGRVDFGHQENGDDHSAQDKQHPQAEQQSQPGVLADE
jgi:hypothetical protein